MHERMTERGQKDSLRAVNRRNRSLVDRFIDA